MDDLSRAVEHDAPNGISPSLGLHFWSCERRSQPYREERSSGIVGGIRLTQGENVQLPVRRCVGRQGMSGVDKGTARQAGCPNWVGVVGETKLIVGEQQRSKRWETPTQLPGRALLALLSRWWWVRTGCVPINTSECGRCLGHDGPAVAWRGLLRQRGETGN